MTLNDGWHYYSFMKEEVHGVFIDFQKKHLIHYTMIYYSANQSHVVRGIDCTWLNSYLDNRQQYSLLVATLIV